jgi:hypothetical protein
VCVGGEGVCVKQLCFLQFYNGNANLYLGVSKVSKFSSNESKRFIAIKNFELERHGN